MMQDAALISFLQLSCVERSMGKGKDTRPRVRRCMTEAEKEARRVRKRANDVVGSLFGSHERCNEHDEEADTDESKTMAETTMTSTSQDERQTSAPSPEASTTEARSSSPAAVAVAAGTQHSSANAGCADAPTAAAPAGASAPPMATASTSTSTAREASSPSTGSPTWKETWFEDIFADMLCNDEFVDDQQSLMDDEEMEEEEEDECQTRDQAEGGGGLLLASAPALCRETLDGSVSKRFILLALLRICEMSDFSLVIGCKLQNCSSRRIQLCWFGSRLLAVTCASFLLRSMHNELLPRSLDILR
mmetsp:Transcript_12474/g.31102  ORF Transcript_12474/g.31102 Transcript_12474/m.31102 type:complete len:305 (+) Transcript_12474:82-996(+)